MGVEVKLPEFGAGHLAMAAEENSIVAGENNDCRFFKQNAAVTFAQGANSNQVVLEIGHDVAGHGG